MTDRKRLLYLCHRIPYPPNKGDKIRSYNLLLWLSERYDVLLGAFVDSTDDWQYTSRLEQLCLEAKFLPLPLGMRKAMRTAGAFIRGQPLTNAFYRSDEMQGWVDSTVRCYKPSVVLIFSSAMGQFLTGARRAGSQSIVDFVDVDSEKWQQYSRSRRWPMSYVYAREARLLTKYEEKLCRQADRSYFVSEAEATDFRRRNPHLAEKVATLRNGVDVEYFDSGRQYPSPYSSCTTTLLFTGAMDYWPNIDAVTWFSRSVMPLLRQFGVDPRFYIVGAQPTESVKRLASRDTFVTGGVADIRPYMAHADVVVAPLRVARGIQNKVLEAMAMKKVVITTSAGAEGIGAINGVHLWIHDDEHAMASRVAAILNSQVPATGAAAQDYILTHFRWSMCLQPLQLQIDSAN